MREIIVLRGGQHKGIVKLESAKDGQDLVVGSCKLDFVPKDAMLYLIGDNITKTAVYEMNTIFEVPFRASKEFGCMLQSRAVTMFGGELKKGEMVCRVEEYKKSLTKNDDGDNVADCITQGQEHCFSKSDENVPCESCKKDECKCDKSCKCEGVENCACSTHNFSEKSTDKIGEKLDDKINEKLSVENNEKSTETYDVKTQVKIGDMRDINEWVKYDGNNFYYAIKPQLDEMFVCYPECKELNDTMPRSKWVRVDAPDGAYVVGVVYDESDTPQYICYGVPAKSNTHPPRELGDTCKWIAVDDMQGYWIIYQSAKNGSICS